MHPYNTITLERFFSTLACKIDHIFKDSYVIPLCGCPLLYLTRPLLRNIELVSSLLLL